MLAMASLLSRLTWCDRVRCLARVMTLWPLSKCQPCRVGCLVDISCSTSTNEEVFRRCPKHPWQPGRRELPLPNETISKWKVKGLTHEQPWNMLERWVNSNCSLIQLIDIVLCRKFLLRYYSHSSEQAGGLNSQLPRSSSRLSASQLRFVLLLSGV